MINKVTSDDTNKCFGVQVVGVRVPTCDELSEPHLHINREVIPIIGLPGMTLEVGHEGALDFR